MATGIPVVLLRLILNTVMLVATSMIESLLPLAVAGRVRPVPNHGLHRLPAVQHEQGALRDALQVPLPHRPRHPRRRTRGPHPLRQGGTLDWQVNKSVYLINRIFKGLIELSDYHGTKTK